MGGIASDRFDPRSAEEFVHLGWTVHDGGRTCRLHYDLGGRRLTETVELSAAVDESDRPTDGALRLLSHVTGTSYYKVGAPPIVAVDDIASPDERSVLDAVYGPGLAEFRWSNALDLTGVPRIVGGGAGDEHGSVARPPASPTGTVLVPVGGGKDSAVTIELLRSAGHDVVLFAVNEHAAIEATIEAAGLPALRVRRRLDPQLFELNAAGALNGHVPVTAIVSALAVLTAVQHGFGAVAMSNERSASAPNLLAGGVAVNHQYSKSLEFERRFQAAVHTAVGADLDYFSLLRPLSELAIMATFAGLERYHRHFTSCNRAFALLDANRSSSWCGDCDKCRFVFLALAPFLGPDRLVPVFGRDLLAATDQLDGFRELVGLRGTKPFECVGEIDECRIAAAWLADPGSAWSDRPVVVALHDEMAARGVHVPDPSVAFAPSDAHLVPPRFLSALDGAAALPSRAAR